jgi:hypothetical protein
MLIVGARSHRSRIYGTLITSKLISNSFVCVKPKRLLVTVNIKERKKSLPWSLRPLLSSVTPIFLSSLDLELQNLVAPYLSVMVWLAEPKPMRVETRLGPYNHVAHLLTFPNLVIGIHEHEVLAELIYSQISIRD